VVFTRVNRLKEWVIGSLVSETGSEFLFGYDPADGLVWLERSGVEYGPSDKVWGEAERTLRGASVTGRNDVADELPGDPEDQYVIQEVSVASVDRPKTVTRSVAGGGEMGIPSSYGDERIVGDFGAGEEYEDDEIAAQASAYLEALEGE